MNIRPGVTILSVLRHLNYRPWFAMAEFVDNSIQSYLAHYDKLRQIEGSDTPLRIDIDYDPSDGGRITIRDNAAGIYENEFPRAFRPAAIPPDRTGLSEFGMGMKSAACWFARRWTVRTAALGEGVERTVDFDVDEIVRDELEELTVKSRPVSSASHYTEVALWDLHKPPKGQTLGKIKEHLASIYRIFIREGQLILRFRGEELTYTEPNILYAPYYRDENGEPVLWSKKIDFDFGLGLRAYGFAAIRETGSVSGNTGFSLFRRSRLIMGSADDGYRPELIFRKSNSRTYQVLFGELHLEGFQVSHTKDGFRWEENEQVFLELLKEHLDAPPLELLDQAENRRVRKKADDWLRPAEKAVDNTAEAVRNSVPPIVSEQRRLLPDSQTPPSKLSRTTVLPAAKRRIDIEIEGVNWQVEIELSTDPAVGDWVELCDTNTLNGNRFVGIRLSLAHPFMDSFGGDDPEHLEALLRLATAIVLAEITARDSGVKLAGTIRRNINKLLREGLSRPS
ncbi:MAG: ATP-binding protein [Anaerolineales bacterium]|nr:ATP-binding protein [Anaerolineales bacterium]